MCAPFFDSYFSSSMELCKIFAHVSTWYKYMHGKNMHKTFICDIWNGPNVTTRRGGKQYHFLSLRYHGFNIRTMQLTVAVPQTYEFCTTTFMFIAIYKSRRNDPLKYVIRSAHFYKWKYGSLLVCIPHQSKPMHKFIYFAFIGRQIRYNPRRMLVRNFFFLYSQLNQ